MSRADELKKSVNQRPETIISPQPCNTNDNTDDELSVGIMGNFQKIKQPHDGSTAGRIVAEDQVDAGFLNINENQER